MGLQDFERGMLEEQRHGLNGGAVHESSAKAASHPPLGFERGTFTSSENT